MVKKIAICPLYRPLLYGLPPSWRPLFVLRKGVVRRNRQFFILGSQGRGKPTCQN